MNKTKVALLAAFALSTAGLAFNSANAADTATTVNTGKANAQCASGQRGSHRGGFVKELGISTEQLEKMNSLKLSFENSKGPKVAELKSLHRELRDDITKPGVSKTELLSLQSKINGIRDDLSNSRINYVAEKIAMLTDDQKAKVREFALKHEMRPGGGHHGRGGHHNWGGNGSRGGGKPGSRSFGGDNKAFNQPAPGPISTPTAPTGA